jgi:hypothetical protein
MKNLCTKFDAAAEAVNGTTPSISELNELYARVLPILPATVTSTLPAGLGMLTSLLGCASLR